MKNYQWRTQMDILSGGFVGEETGVIPNDQSWKTTDATTGTMTAEYYYRDSTVGQNANSSRVVVSLSESWTASVDNRNNLIIDLSTDVTGIRRDDLRGTVGAGWYNLFIRREAGGQVLWSIGGDPVNTAHTILGSTVHLGDYHFVLAPGENLTHSSIYFRNNYIGHDNDPIPSEYVDVMQMGVEFKNILPADYRPGKIWDGSTWQSHNRAAGFEKIYTDPSTTREMRTIDGGVGTGNPPLIYNERWLNERLIGQE